MKTIVLYTSKTGFTENYAKMIAQELGCEALNFKGVKANSLSQYDLVIYGGGIYAGKINSIKKAKDAFYASKAKKLIVFATGAAPVDAGEVIDNLWKTNLASEELSKIPHFYMQSGLNYEKMSGFNRFLMKKFASIMEKKDQKDPLVRETQVLIKDSFDYSSPEFIKELVALAKGMN